VGEPDQRTDFYANVYGRLRAATQAPDRTVWILTGNTGSRLGESDDDDDLRLELATRLPKGPCTTPRPKPTRPEHDPSECTPRS